MNCLSDQQLAEIVLGTADAESGDAHLATCGICRAKIAELRRMPEHFARADANRDRDHAASRAKLLTEIGRIDESRPTIASSRFRHALGRFSRRQRITIGGLGLSAAAVLLIAIFVANTARPLSAMERMVKQLRKATSFSFELEETSDRISGDHRRRILRNDTNFWRAPAAWHGTTKMVKLPLPPPPGAAGELLVDVEEIYSPGERGILIDHKKKTFFRTRVMEPNDFPDYSPVNWVQRMSTGNVKVVSDLGTKQLHGKTAHGYVVSLGNPDPTSGQNAIEVWLDPETDLPIEFRYEDKGETETIDAWTNVMRVYNCRWNIELDDAVFAMNEPAGYDDTSWSTDTKVIEQVVESLRLHAKLSGGHYPRVAKFDADEVHNEMLRLAGTLPPQTDTDRDALLEQIQQAKAGVDWTAQILKNEHHSGYYGMEVGPNDPQKLLMWWPDHSEDYRVIYGDLRTEALTYADWLKLVPPEVAESHAPVEYAKPGL
jgi:hypothetical protein